MRLPALLLALVITFVAAQNPGFTNPAVDINQNDYDFNPVWYVGETQIVSWNTPFSNYSITLWQETLQGGSATAGTTVYAIQPGAANVMSFPWTVTTGAFDLRVSPVFFFWLTSGQTAGAPGNAGSSTSRYFNISAKAPPSSSTSTSAQVPSTSTTAPARNTTSSPPAPSSPSTGLSTGAKVGIALGAIIIIAGIIGVAIFFALKRRKETKRVSEPPQYMQEKPQRHAEEPPQKVHQHAELYAGQSAPAVAELS